MKRPAFQFYPGDWRKDVELRSCSIGARGLWIDLMCLAHSCVPYGHLVVNGKPMTAAQIAGQVGLSPGAVGKLVAELLDNGVARQTADGVLYSKRMVEDEALRNARAEGGKAGAAHGSKGAEFGSRGGRPKKGKGGLETPLETPLEGSGKPPPSSSSSPSGNSVPDGTGGLTAQPAPPAERTQPTARERLFANGVPLLQSAGVTDRSARSMLALLCKSYGDEAVANVVDKALLDPPIDPSSWLHRELKGPDPLRPRNKPAQANKHAGAGAALFDGATHV